MTSTTLRQRIPPKRVLVVEDELLAAHSIRMILSVDGHTVDIAEDGEQGLAMFTAGEYDLVITDFQLAKMDGLELAEAIKQHSPAMPIILVTAYAEKVRSGMGQVSNVDLLLSKPVSVAELHGALSKMFPPAEG